MGSGITLIDLIVPPSFLRLPIMSPRPSLFLAVAAACVLPALALHAATLADLPAPAQKALAAQLQGGNVESVEKSDDHGHVSYDVEISKGGDTRSYTVSADGALESAEVTLAETPAPVQKAIAAQIGSASLDEIQRSGEAGEVTYDVDWTNAAGEPQSFAVNETGAIVSVSVALKDAPEAIRRAINTEIAGGKLESIDKASEEGETTYDVSWTDKAGSSQNFSLSDKGVIISAQVSLSGVPGPVQKTIEGKVGAGTILRIDHSKEGKKKGGNTFEVEARVNGQVITFRVGPKGKLLADD